MTTYTQIADKLHSHANAVLERLQLSSHVKELGALYFSGSYALNLMTWNDIDMQLVVNENTPRLEALTTLLKDMATIGGFQESHIMVCTAAFKPKMPRGLYLGMKFTFPDLGGLWKLDLWSLEKHDFEKNRHLLEQIKSSLSDEVRELILEIKHELMQATGRVPQGGSHLLYQAILLHGLKDKQAIFDFLRTHGVL